MHILSHAALREADVPLGEGFRGQGADQRRDRDRNRERPRERRERECERMAASH